MANIEVAALNIKIFRDPTPQKYVDLFEFLAQKLIWYHVWSDRYGYVSRFNRGEDGGELVYHGTITKFVGDDDFIAHIGAYRDVIGLHVDGKKVIIKDEVVGLIKGEIAFDLFPNRHLLVFDPRVISPKNLCKFMASLCGRHIMPLQFGYVNVEVIAQLDIIDELIQKKIKTLTIALSAPNGDFIDHDDRLFGKLKQQQIHRVEMKFEAPSGLFIELNRNGREAKLAKLALTDGEVVALCLADDGSYLFKSIERPFIIGDKYNPKQNGYKAAFSEAAKKIINMIGRKRGKPSR